MTKRLALVGMMIVAGLPLANWTSGETAPTSQPSHGHNIVAHLTKELNLSADQQAQVQAILEQVKADAAHATDMQARGAIWKAAFEKIQADVLNDQQRAEFQKMNMHGDPHKVIGYQALNLSEEQQAQVQTILEQARTDAAQATDRQAQRDVWKAAIDEINTTVLTQEQRDQLAQLRAGCKGCSAAASEPAGAGQ